MKKIMFITFLAVILAACAPATAPAPTKTSIPTFMPVPPTATPTLEITLIPATVMPTQPPFVPVITPDAIQVERWKEYQTELAKRVLSDSGADFPYFEAAVCEWDILGRSGQEVYVWASCASPNSGGGKPAVIYLGKDESIQRVRVAGYKGLFYNLELFPTEVQAKIYLYPSSERSIEMGKHCVYRLTHSEIPPLIILSTIPTATPMP